MIFYGLLYIDDKHNTNPNLKGNRGSTDVYISCACLCAKTFHETGAEFCLITNNESYVRERIKRLALDPLVTRNHNFSLSVPINIPFYSAHFKLEILSAFGRGVFGDQVGLVDIDTVAFRGLPCSNELAVYDISEQIFAAHDRQQVIADMEKISGRHLPNARWYGGEFLMGSAKSFSTIAAYIELFWPNYVSCIQSLHHVGDEMIVSSALNVARTDGLRTIDYGDAGLVARWWTARTRHRQVAFDAVANAALLHLPADKVFLAEEAQCPFEPHAFIRKFRRYALKKILIRSVVGGSRIIAGQAEKIYTKTILIVGNSLVRKTPFVRVIAA